MNKKIENAKRTLLKEDRFYDDETEIEATKVLLEYIKELEQKESILDKVTDKLKELDFRLYLQREEDSALGKDINTIINVRLDLDKILNIIEGEKK